MSKHETREALARTDAAQRLRTLADQVQAGRVSLQGFEATLPDQVRFEFEVDRDEVEVKMKWRA